MGELVIEIFSRNRANLIKIYEILKCCTGTPLSMYKIGKLGSMRVTDRGSDKDIVAYLVSKGFLSKITPEEYMKRGNYKQPYRKPGGTILAYYETTGNGITAIMQFEGILDLLGFRKLRIRRFSK